MRRPASRISRSRAAGAIAACTLSCSAVWSEAVVITGVACNRTARCRARALPPPQWPESRLMTKRPAGSSTTTGGSWLLCRSRGASTRTAMPVAPTKTCAVWRRYSRARKAARSSKGQMSASARRAGALIRQVATLRPSGAHQGAAGSRAASRRARGRASRLKAWQSRAGTASASTQQTVPASDDLWLKKAPCGPHPARG